MESAFNMPSHSGHAVRNDRGANDTHEFAYVRRMTVESLR